MPKYPHVVYHAEPSMHPSSAWRCGWEDGRNGRFSTTTTHDDLYYDDGYYVGSVTRREALRKAGHIS